MAHEDWARINREIDAAVDRRASQLLDVIEALLEELRDGSITFEYAYGRLDELRREVDRDS